MTTLVTDNMQLLASSPNGIKRIRALILELAVTGRLVEQDPAEEPVEKLIGRISAIKEAEIAAGRLKRQKASEVAPDAPKHGIPPTWRFVQLGDVVEIVRGITFPASEKSKEPGPGKIACLRTANVQDEIEWDDLLFVGESFVGRADQYLQPRDIVMSMANSRELVGKVALVSEHVSQRATFGGFLGVLRPYLVEPRYVMALLRTPRARAALIDSASQTTNIANVSLSKLRPLPVALPPLEEQHRIVAKVDELMALCDRLEAEQVDAEAAHAKLVEALLASLTQARDAADFRASWQQLAEHFHTLFTTEASVDALKQTVLQLAVTGRLLPLETTSLDGSGECIGSIPLPRHWDVVPFNDLVDQNFPIAYGVLVPGPEAADGVPFVRIADLSLSAPPQLPEKRISREVDAKFSRTRLVGGEILMGVVGSIGKLGIAPPSWAGANIARAICRIVPAPTISREFVLWLLQSDLMRNQFIGDTRTLAQPTLNVGLIRAARTPLPPLEEQQRIVAMIDRLMALCDELQRSLADADEHHQNLASVLVAQAVA